jgi:hypothetical protein
MKTYKINKIVTRSTLGCACVIQTAQLSVPFSPPGSPGELSVSEVVLLVLLTMMAMVAGQGRR